MVLAIFYKGWSDVEVETKDYEDTLKKSWPVYSNDDDDDNDS